MGKCRDKVVIPFVVTTTSFLNLYGGPELWHMCMWPAWTSCGHSMEFVFFCTQSCTCGCGSVKSLLPPRVECRARAKILQEVYNRSKGPRAIQSRATWVHVDPYKGLQDFGDPKWCKTSSIVCGEEPFNVG